MNYEKVAKKVAEKFVGYLQEDTHAVAGLSLCILAGAVFQVFYYMKSIFHGLVAPDAVAVHNCADTTVVMLELFSI